MIICFNIILKSFYNFSPDIKFTKGFGFFKLYSTTEFTNVTQHLQKTPHYFSKKHIHGYSSRFLEDYKRG